MRAVSARGSGSRGRFDQHGHHDERDRHLTGHADLHEPTERCLPAGAGHHGVRDLLRPVGDQLPASEEEMGDRRRRGLRGQGPGRRRRHEWRTRRTGGRAGPVPLSADADRACTGNGQALCLGDGRFQSGRPGARTSGGRDRETRSPDGGYRIFLVLQLGQRRDDRQGPERVRSQQPLLDVRRRTDERAGGGRP